MPKCEQCWGTGEILDQVELGSIARDNRLRLGLTLRESARQLGVNYSYLSLLERGRRRWPVDLYRKATR